MTTARIALALLATAAPAVTFAQGAPLIRNLGAVDYSGVEAVAAGIAQDGEGLAYRSHAEEGPFTFEADFTPAADTSKLAAFSDDGVTVSIAAADESGGATTFETTNVSNLGVGQALPKLGQSLKPIIYDFEAGKSYRVRVVYSNTVYTGSGDIDGVLLFAYAGGGTTGTRSPFPVNLVAAPSADLPVGTEVTITASHPDVESPVYTWRRRCLDSLINPRTPDWETNVITDCAGDAGAKSYSLEVAHSSTSYDSPGAGTVNVEWHAPDSFEIKAGAVYQIPSPNSPFLLSVTPVMTTLKWGEAALGACARVNCGERVTYTGIHPDFEGYSDFPAEPGWWPNWPAPSSGQEAYGSPYLPNTPTWSWNAPVLTDLSVQGFAPGAIDQYEIGEVLFLVHREYRFVGPQCAGSDWELRTGVVTWAARVVGGPNAGKYVQHFRL